MFKININFLKVKNREILDIDFLELSFEKSEITIMEEDLGNKKRYLEVIMKFKPIVR